MTGIPTRLSLSLRDVLAGCDEFQSVEQLKMVFNDPLIEPWKTSLRPSPRVNEWDLAEYVITTLKDERRADTDANILLLLLSILQERAGARRLADARYREMANIARQLEIVLQSKISFGTSQYIEEANSGNQEMLFTEDIRKLFESVQAVAKVRVPKFVASKQVEQVPSGTGWLIAPGLALTCLHVLKAQGQYDGRLREVDFQRQVEESAFIFDYSTSGRGESYGVKERECQDDVLDYAVLRLHDRPSLPLRTWGFLKYTIDEPMNAQTELYVIQHPKGEIQRLAYGRFKDVVQDKPNTILHSAPTEPGTSGGPVLNRQNWRVMALHNGEHPTYHLREATLLSAIMADIQQKNQNLFDEIHSAASER